MSARSLSNFVEQIIEGIDFRKFIKSTNDPNSDFRKGLADIGNELNRLADSKDYDGLDKFYAKLKKNDTIYKLVSLLFKSST